jgi:hypothetical protein
MCLCKLFNLIFGMAQTAIHGGLNESITTALQFTSQMSNYASISHIHTQYLTTAAPSNHVHTQYLNISESGNIYFQNSNGVSFGQLVSGNSTTVTATVYLTLGTSSGINIGNMIFLNSNGHTFGSSTSGVSSYYWIKTN